LANRRAISLFAFQRQLFVKAREFFACCVKPTHSPFDLSLLFDLPIALDAVVGLNGLGIFSNHSSNLQGSMPSLPCEPGRSLLQLP
jgi:hypothetical protein